MKILRSISLLMAGLLAFFQPLQLQHGEGLCCAECALKKEEDEIEYVDEESNDRLEN